MAANPALWADVLRDIDAATALADRAARRAKALSTHGEELEVDAREDSEWAIGVMLHHCYVALENALERLIKVADGSAPTSAQYHADLVERAARPVRDVRVAMITAHTASLMHKLRGFRHAFRYASVAYDYDLAAENVPFAEELVPRFRSEIMEFALRIGLIDKQT